MKVIRNLYQRTEAYLRIEKEDLRFKIRGVEQEKPLSPNLSTCVPEMGYIIKESKFKYAGHIMRASNHRISKIVAEWRPYGYKKERGEPKTRWRDEMERRVGKVLNTGPLTAKLIKTGLKITVSSANFKNILRMGIAGT